MNTTLPASRTKNWTTSIRDFSEKVSMAAFLFAWPLVTLYIAIAWLMIDAAYSATGNTAESLYALGAIMLYVYPLIVWLKIKVSYLAIGMAAISLRPPAMLIAVVTWLSLNGHNPTGIVPMDGLGWTDPVLYSTLTILAAFLSWMRASTEHASSTTSPLQRFRAMFSHQTPENRNGSED